MNNLIELEDVLRIARISGLRAGPGRGLAFNVTRPDPEENADRTEMWVRWPGGEWSYYTGEADSSPEWRPGGGLAFVSRRGAGKDKKGSGVFLVERSGEPRLLAWFRHGVRGMRWLDRDRLVVASPVPEGWFYDEDGDYVATDRLPLWFDGQGLVAGRSVQLFLLDAYSGRREQLTREGLSVGAFAACPDGSIVYSVPEDWRVPWRSVVKRLRPGGEPVELARGVSVSRLECTSSRELLFLGHRGEIGMSSHNRLYQLSDDGGLECLSCGLLDRNIWSARPDPAGGVVLLVADAGRTPVYRLVEGELETVASGDFVAYEAEPGEDAVYLVLTTPTSPPDIYMAREGRLEKITRFNGWAETLRLSAPEHLAIETEGERVDGWVLLPPEGAPRHGERLPLVLFVHGGPKGMYGYMFHYEMQLWASQGFIVAYSNPHGSDGYSEEFADIRGKYGDIDYRQIMAFLDEVTHRYPVDEKRMAVTGISYGGYMTNHIVTMTDRFAAAVSENGIADWIADYWAADIGYWFDPDQIGGTPLDSLENYLHSSPAYRADRVQTPMLIIHSLEDYRCFIDQALAMHTALKAKGKDSTLLVFTRGSHGHSIRAPPRHRRKRLEVKLRWVKEKLGIAVAGENGLGSKT